MDHQFFIASNNGYTPEQVQLIKKNNFFVLCALNSLVLSLQEGGPLGGEYHDALVSGTLPSDASNVEVGTARLAEKLKRLTLDLEGRNRSAHQEKFKKSYFMRCVLSVLHTGYISNSDAQWINYSATPALEECFKTSGALNTALAVWRDDPDAPIGLNVALVVDTYATFLPGDKLRLSPEPPLPLEREIALTEALRDELIMLKSRPRFMKNFHNPFCGDTLF